nr:hypothetical protein CFP56_28722 [Quercus suber]
MAEPNPGRNGGSCHKQVDAKVNWLVIRCRCRIELARCPGCEARMYCDMYTRSARVRCESLKHVPVRSGYFDAEVHTPLGFPSPLTRHARVEGERWMVEKPAPGSLAAPRLCARCQVPGASSQRPEGEQQRHPPPMARYVDEIDEMAERTTTIRTRGAVQSSPRMLTHRVPVLSSLMPLAPGLELPLRLRSERVGGVEAKSTAVAPSHCGLAAKR